MYSPIFTNNIRPYSLWSPAILLCCCFVLSGTNDHPEDANAGAGYDIHGVNFHVGSIAPICHLPGSGTIQCSAIVVVVVCRYLLLRNDQASHLWGRTVSRRCCCCEASLCRSYGSWETPACQTVGVVTARQLPALLDCETTWLYFSGVVLLAFAWFQHS